MKKRNYEKKEERQKIYKAIALFIKNGGQIKNIPPRWERRFHMVGAKKP